MDNRWTLKDSVIVALLLLMVIVVLLAMVQFDRQYQLVRDLQDTSNSQLAELVSIDRALQHGITVGSANGGMTAPTTQSANDLPGPFDAIEKLKSEGKYAQGDWLVENLGATVSKVTPLVTTDAYGAMMQARVMESLAYRNADTLEYIPQLAESWTPTVDNRAAWLAYINQRKAVPLTQAEVEKESDCPPADKPDDRKTYITKRLADGRKADDIENEPGCPPAMTITFKMRKGVTFSDGSPFSADDVIFSYDWIENPKVDAPRDRAALDKVKSVTKLGDDQVVFAFKEPYYAAFDLASGLSVMSKAFYSHYTPEQYNESVGLLIGTGPYRLESPTGWTPNAAGTVQLVRNERYWGEPSSFNKLVYYQISGDTAELTMFINGQLDLFGAQPEQYGTLLKNPDVTNRTQHFEYLSPAAGYAYIAWNEKRDGKDTLFTDKRVRQALTQLIDRKGICDSVLLGYAQPAQGPFNPLSKQNDPQLKDWQYDPAAAKKLLQDAGFEFRDNSGVLKKADGTPLAFKLTYPSKNETSERIMLLVKDNLVRSGVAAEVDPVDFPILLKRLDTRDFDAISLSWTAGLEDDIFQMFDSSQMADQGDNFMSYSNPEFDKVVQQARTTLDESQRMPLWQQADRILHEDQPYTFLIVRKSLLFLDSRIQNVHISKMGMNFDQLSSMPIEWSVPIGKQKYKQ